MSGNMIGCSIKHKYYISGITIIANLACLPEHPLK